MTTKIPVELSSTPGIVDESNATAITIDSSEKVGIGDTSPIAKLTVKAASDTIRAESLATDAKNITMSYHDSDDRGQIISTQDGVADKDLLLRGANLLFQRSGGTEAMRIDSDGDVGINTTSPISGSKLDVVDTSDMTMRVRSTGASSAAVRFHNSNTGTSTSNGLFVGIDATGNGYLWNYNNYPVLIGANNTETMRVTSARGGGSGMTLSVGGNGGICFGSSEANTGGAFMAAADNAQSEGIVFYLTASASEWQPASIIAHCSKIDTDQSDHNYGNVAYAFSIFNGNIATVQKYEENPSGGAGITWSLNDLGGTTTMQIQILATSNNSTGPRIVLSAWAANYSGVLEANRS